MQSKSPFFSIIIPTFDRPEQLSNCLQAITQLEYPRDCFEVIVVNDGSPKSLEDVVAKFEDRLNSNLLAQENKGPAIARNAGARQAKGKYLAFTDDDCTPAPNWLKALASSFEETPVSIAGGKTLNKLSGNLYSTASQLLIDYLYLYYNADPRDARFVTSNNMAIPTETFHAIGGFDETFPLAAGEDRELCDRWLYHGYKMTYVPEAVIYHFHKLTLFSYCRQHFAYGRGAFSFHRIRARRGYENVQVEPLSFYLDLLKFPFQTNSGWQALILSALQLVNQVSNVAGYFWSRFGNRK